MSALQESIRAFLMTDIVGSTVLTQERPEDYHRALLAHNDLAERIFEAEGGRLVKARGQGDGLLGEFPVPAAAVKAAIAFRDGVNGIEVAGGPLSIRAGIHYGPCYGSGDDYFGHTLNLCARLRDVGHPGQILASGLVGDLAGHPTVIELGWHGLRDIAEPVRVLQVGDARSFPKLKTDERFRMPIFATRFVGRRTELSRLSALLEESRVVLIVGPGGIGKTRLAARMAESNPGRPAVFANLIEAVDQASVDRVIGLAFGEASLNAIAKVLTGPTLLVLDNCEHVAEEARSTLDDLVDRYPDLCAVATSRVRIPFKLSRVFLLDGLRDEGPELFRELARADDATIEFGEDDEAEISRICAATDGAPLLLELAAAHVHGLGLAQIRERLGELIQAGPSSLPGRHRGIDAVLSASIQRISQEARQAAGSLSWMAGGFSLEYAERTLGSMARTRIEELISHSLLRFERSAGRYRFLEVIRTYLRDVLGGDGPPAAAFVWAAEQGAALSPKAGDPLSQAQIEIESANLRVLLRSLEENGDPDGVGLKLANDLGRFWTQNGFAEGRSWLSRFLALHPLPAETFDERMLRANAWNRLGVCAYKMGDYPATLEAYQAASVYAEMADNKSLAMSIRLNRGLVYLSQGRHSDARMPLIEAEAFFSAEAMHGHRLIALSNLGRLELEAGDNARARELLTEAAEMAEVIGDSASAALCRTSIAVAFVMECQVSRADEVLSQIQFDALAPSNQAYFHLARACVWKGLGAPERAFLSLAEAEAILQVTGASISDFDRNLRSLASSR